MVKPFISIEYQPNQKHECTNKHSTGSRCRVSFITKLINLWDILEPDLNLHKFKSGCKLSPKITTLYILYTCDQFRSGSNMSPIIISWQSGLSVPQIYHIEGSGGLCGLKFLGGTTFICHFLCSLVTQGPCPLMPRAF